jgi:hypothetical protein
VNTSASGPTALRATTRAPFTAVGPSAPISSVVAYRGTRPAETGETRDFKGKR